MPPNGRSGSSPAAARIPKDSDGYAVPHTALTYLIDPAGRYHAHWGDARTAGEIAAEIRAAVGI